MSSASFLTKELLQPGIQKIKRDKTITIKEIQYAKSTNELDGAHFASGIDFADILISSEKKKTDETVSIFIKRQANSDVHKSMMGDSNIFEKEGGFYGKLLPEMVDFCKIEVAALPVKIDVFIPKCFYASSDGDMSAVVLENLAKQGYELKKHDVNELQDANHVKLVMSSIAQFHAASYAMKKKMNLPEKYPLLREIWYIKDDNGFLYTLIKKLFEIATSMFDETTEIGQSLRKFCKLGFDYIIETSTKPCEPFNVINHGDLWNNNILFKYDSTKKPTSVMLVDWQCLRYSSMALDLTYFLFTSTTSQFRREHTREMLQIYYSKFVDTSRRFGINKFDTNEFSFEAMYEDYLARRLVGFAMVPAMLIVGLCAKEDFEGTDTAKENPIDKLGNMLKQLMENQEKIDIMKTIISDAYYEVQDLLKAL